jgi:bifunctional DNA-binding transcriptional regulator/antitoxin component of YhaV-PrlF toxin-antitoxin module
MISRLTRVGDGYGLVIPQAVLEALNIDPEAPLEVTAERGSAFVRPAPPEAGDHRDRVQSSAARMAEIHRESLRKLAE